MTRRDAITLTFAGVCLPAARAGSNEDEARGVAETWLALVDAGDYAKSWDEAAAGFRKAVSKATWIKQAGAARGPLGKLNSRNVIAAVYRTSLPGAPDGEYVVIQYRASYANKAEAIETVTPTKDPDGKWRVSGYFVR